VIKKLKEYVDRDLKAMFNEVVATNGGEVPRFAAALRERCYALDRCKPLLPAGRRPSRP